MNSNDSVVERTFMALADLARRSEDEEITTDLLYEVVCEWTTDEITENGPVGSDSMILGSYMIEHLSTQRRLNDSLSLMEGIIIALDGNDIDPTKLIERDSDEWQKLGVALATGSDESYIIDEEVELTVADILAVETEVDPEGDWKAVTNAAILEKIDYQLFLNEVISIFLQATLNNDYDRVHEIIEDLECELVHGLANMMLMWVGSHSTMAEGVSLEEWVAGLEAMAEQVSSMPENERIEFAKNHLIGYGELGGHED